MSEPVLGPWTIRTFTDARVMILGPVDPASSQFEVIATIEAGPESPRGEANARLIAASPDLLNGYRLLREICDNGIRPDLSLVKNLANMMLAKAVKEDA